MVRKILIITVAVVFLAALSQVWAEEPAKQRLVNKKTIQGEVSGIGLDFIAITYEMDATSSKDMLLPFDENITIQNKKTLKQIQIGDTAAVEYDEVTENGKKSRRAKRVIFVKPAFKKVESTTLDTGTEDLPEGT